MIEKMHKYAFVVHHKRYDAFLEALRDWGVVHINLSRSVMEEPELQELMTLRKKVSVLRKQMLSSCSATKDRGEDMTSIEAGLNIVSTWEGLQKKKNTLYNELQSVQKELSVLEVWGDFEMSSMEKLREIGWEMNFWSCNKGSFKEEWKEKYNAVQIENRQSVLYFITITHSGMSLDMEADRVLLPKDSYTILEGKSEIIKKNIDTLEKEIQTFASKEHENMGKLECLLEEKFNLLGIQSQTEKILDNRLFCLEGWIPDEKVKMLEENLEKEDVFFKELEIEERDNVPIKLKNNSFSKLFEPIIKIYSLPNYGELDSTPFVAPFFMLFFGLCFGDGGYGLLVLIASLFLKKRVKESMKPILSLFCWLSGMAVVVGIVTGSFFGISFAELSIFSSVKEYFVNSDNLMTFSIAIGLFQIVVGKSVAAYKIKIQQGTKYCITPFAWVVVISSLSLCLGLPMLGVRLSSWVENVFYVLAGIAFIFVMFYNKPGKNIFLNFGNGLYSIYNMASGLLGDTLSYIRLFAIGLTGSILGGVFNTLSISMTEGMNPIIGWIITLLILLIGHGMNFGLCMISAFVHPMRLIFVEYYKNSEFEGGGKAYNPYQAVRNED
ncbi:MAG TPA: ATPase [Porphyromonadaceae bacterium]|nr:ATPase [Porphyromonadaceae bacterium]